MHKKWQATFIALTLTLTGCGGGNTDTNQSSVQEDFPREKLTITLWRDVNELPAFEEAISQYRDQHPNVSFKYITAQSDSVEDYELKTVNELATGKGPDIISIPNDRVARLADKLVGAPQEVFGTASPVSFVTSRYAPAVATDVIVDNKVYGLPLYVDTLALFVNREMLNNLYSEFVRDERINNAEVLLQPPADWSKVVEIAKLITKRNGEEIERSAITLGTTANVPNAADITAALLLQQGATMVSSDKKNAAFHLADTTDPSFYPGVSVLNFLRGFSDPKSDYYTWNKNMPDGLQAFLDGKVAMTINYDKVQGFIQQRRPNLNYTVSPFPQIAGARKIVDYGDYWVEAVTNNSKYPQVAWDFLRFYSESFLGNYELTTGRPSPLRQLSTSTVQERIGLNSPFSFQTGTARSWYKGKDPVAADKFLNDMVDRVTLSGSAAKESLDRAAQEMTKLFQ